MVVGVTMEQTILLTLLLATGADQDGITPNERGRLCIPHDVDRFPPDPVIKETRRRGELYRANLVSLMAAFPSKHEYAIAYYESSQADLAWGDLWGVRPMPRELDTWSGLWMVDDTFFMWGSGPGRDAVWYLTRLRDRIGPQAYATGTMPPLCPPEYFTDVP